MLMASWHVGMIMYISIPSKVLNKRWRNAPMREGNSVTFTAIEHRHMNNKAYN